MSRQIKDKIKGRSFRELLAIFDEKYGIGMLERIFASNWFNPLATLWLNFRSFPLGQALRLPVWCYGRPRIYGLSGHMVIEGKLRSGMVRLNKVIVAAPSNMGVQTEILNNGTIIFKGKLHIGTGSKIVVGRNATLSVGQDSKIGDMCNIGCFERITLGDLTRIVHRCQIFDSNYHFVANLERGIIPNYKRPVTLGKGCWICNSSTITCGVTLPDYTIVSSNSLVNKEFTDIENGALIGGIPAKVIATGVRRVYNNDIEKQVEEFYRLNPSSTYKIDNSIEADVYSHINKL